MDDSRAVFAVALCSHLFAVAATTVTGLNPDATGDVDAFETVAERFGSLLLQGTVPAVNWGSTDQVWGIFLAPFWMLPGPSLVYGRLSSAVMGAVAAYNVYLIARTYHSRRAGVFAAAPLVVYPSVLSSHSTILRETIILCGLTTVAQIYMLQRCESAAKRHLLTAIVMTPVILQRTDNLPVYALVFAVAAVVSLVERHELRPRVYGAMAAVSIPVSILARPEIRSILSSLAGLRRARATGRTAYLTGTFPETVPAAIAFSWVGFAYFLYTPFPWMIGVPLDALIAVEGVVNLVYSVAAIAGARLAWQRSAAATAALVVGIVVGGVLYGLGTANVGTAVRHRQMVLWVLFVLGGIGLADRISVRATPLESD